MKKTFCIVAIFAILFTMLFAIPTYAAETLNSVNVTVSKERILPGENVTITVNFGRNLNSYTVNVAYDSNLFDYVSSEGGTASDSATGVIVYYFDQSGASNPRNSMSVTFKAKTGLTTSNPTSFDITAEGLASVSDNVTTDYEDITTPIKKNVVVGPEETTNEPQQNTTTIGVEENTTNQEQATTNKTPSTMPKTGGTVYAGIFAIISVLVVVFFLMRNRK